MTADADTYGQVLGDLQAQLFEAEREVAAITAQLDRARAQRDEVKQEFDIVRRSMLRQFPSVQESEAEPLPFNIRPVGIDRMPRTYAVLVAVKQLTSAEGSASPEAIEQYLQTEGRSDSRQDIGGALSHLRRTGKIARISRGRWIPVDSSPNMAAADTENKGPE